MPALQEYYHVITSTAWMVILSIIPQDLVRTAAVLLGGLICVYNIIHAVRPQTLIKKLQLRLLSLEGKLQDAIDSGIMAQADPVFTAQIERSMGRICYRTSELYEITLLMSGGILPEMKAVWQGHSLNIIKCLRDVDNLEVDLEINRATVLKNRYHFWM
ncbi:hypothetical protein K443DRAFT_7459 [Laccaria amethystina LaAM-08-1]|uniref:Uncharacterized protein n=1 Tax=Laccaria amethystina LaAM-08-1 TaxID=1095629 RepID=A0A0C9XGG4_9AGAR|nr:hypothetical protein K443DRAFT_7459 [Laccaria amethystina LaAM-08-1]